MLKHIAVALMALCAASAVRADYIADRDAAAKLSQAGKHEEALAAFLKLAERAETDVQKGDALEQAARSALRLRKLDQATELAKKIPQEIPSKACQLDILESSRKWSDVTAQFGAEDFDKWPKAQAAQAYSTRGRAYYTLKQGEKAEADLTKAAELLTEGNAKGLALNFLGDTYHSLLKDDARAVETYRKAYATALYKRCQAAIAVSAILSKQKKHEEALAELQTIDMNQVKHPAWRASMIEAHGDVLAAQGKKAEAVARYEEALKVVGIPAGDKAGIEKKLKALQAEAK